MKETVGAIIQARTASTRLQGKVLKVMPGGYSVIEAVIRRTMAVESVDHVVVAMPEADRCGRLPGLCCSAGAEVFFGSSDDVLDRFYRCAEQYRFDLIVRVTADDPFRDPEVTAKAVSLMLEDKTIDYLDISGYPDGIGVELFRCSALSRAWREATLNSEREHVTPYIWKNRHIFNTRTIKSDRRWTDWRLTLDEETDWQLVFEIDRRLAREGEWYGLAEIDELLNAHPEIAALNSHLVKNAGYIKSLEVDGKS